jgi:asparagine synthetase B (glutamine-hydrolysing)
MCGIAGKVAFDPGAVTPDLLRRMGSVQRQRGPDEEGVHLCTPVVDHAGAATCGLSHRRLSIIDLSAAGREPMPNEDESLWLVCNGEIYNFSELRAELTGRGHRFRSGTDVEVIVHLYEEIGVLELWLRTFIDRSVLSASESLPQDSNTPTTRRWCCGRYAWNDVRGHVGPMPSACLR